jgi:type I restriction enzyme S subunit
MFENAIKPALTQILGNGKESRTLASLRDTLLPKLISGELRVPDAEQIMEVAS